MEYKGITVKIDADLHAEVRQYLEATNMTMAEFVTQALDDELHPKFQKEDMKMEKHENDRISGAGRICSSASRTTCAAMRSPSASCWSR